MKHVLYALVGMGLLVACSGCVAAAVGAGAGAAVGTYSYIKGDLQATYEVSLERLWPPTLAAMRDLRLTIDSERRDALGGVIEAWRVDGTPVTVRLKPEAANVTVVSVRVGTFGSREKSAIIHNAIREHLRTT
jgi:hypothetical protein